MYNTNENFADTIKVYCSGIFLNGEKYGTDKYPLDAVRKTYPFVNYLTNGGLISSHLIFSPAPKNFPA